MKRDVVDELDAVSILEFFGDLKDSRSAINRKHLLGGICVICICAVLAGADGPKAIGTWALSKKDWLESLLQLPNGIPSHDTNSRVLATEAKFNEITAIPELISNIEVKGAIVTIDAAGCQKNISKQIVDAGGDYVLALKGNQGNMHKDVINWVSERFENDFADVGLKSIGVATRHCLRAGRESYDTRYYLTTLPVAVKQFAQAVRGHWAIENTLHWCLDVTFREDESRLLDHHAAENVALLRRFGIGLLKRVDSKESIAMRRRMAGWNEDFLSQVLGIEVI